MNISTEIIRDIILNLAFPNEHPKVNCRTNFLEISNELCSWFALYSSTGSLTNLTKRKNEIYYSLRPEDYNYDLDKMILILKEK